VLGAWPWAVLRVLGAWPASPAVARDARFFQAVRTERADGCAMRAPAGAPGASRIADAVQSLDLGAQDNNRFHDADGAARPCVMQCNPSRGLLLR